jgi:predicted metal-binding protein
MEKNYVCNAYGKNPSRFDCPRPESDLQVIDDIVAEFYRYILIHINRIKILSKSFTPEDRKVVVKLLEYQKEVFIDTFNEYE